MIFLTSDPHFGHANIIQYVDRPFESVEEMDETLIKNFNKVVGLDDELYILGDFTMHGDYEKLCSYIDRLNCNNIHLIFGNHDKRFASLLFKSTQDYLELEFNHTRFCLSHYPFLSWHGREQGAIMCHGHIHAKKRTNEINQWQRLRRFDVGVDANDYTPVSIDYILEFFEKPIEEIFN